MRLGPLNLMKLMPMYLFVLNAAAHCFEVFVYCFKALIGESPILPTH